MDDKPDKSPDTSVAKLAAQEWAVLSTEELRACGLSSDMIATRARRGQLHRLHRGVYAVGHLNVTAEGRLLAAVKACGRGAVASHSSAAFLWEILDLGGRVPEVTVSGSTSRLHDGIVVHRTQFLEPRDRRRHQGIPVTAPARTVLDVASYLPYGAARRAARQAISNRLVAVRDLMEVSERLSRRPGARALRRIIADGPVPTRSLLEDAVLDIVAEAGLEPPDVNVPMMVSGRRVIPDFRWPRRRLIVEADGRRWHGDLLAQEDDAERQALLEASGERVVRITWKQAVDRRSETVARLRVAARVSRA